MLLPESVQMCRNVFMNIFITNFQHLIFNCAGLTDVHHRALESVDRDKDRDSDIDIDIDMVLPLEWYCVIVCVLHSKEEPM